MTARYIGNIPKGGKGSITARPKPKKKQRGYGQASEGRTKKQGGGIHDPRNKLTTAQKRFYGGKQRDFTPLSQNDPDRNVRKKRPGGYSQGGRVAKSHGGVASRLSKAGPVANPN